MTVPFTVLSGFLGVGKTTALNRMLRAPLGKKIAVLVNELGRIAIDTSLIVSRGGDVLELAGGCICCKLGKDDLWDGVADIVKRAKPDALVLETTGIAEPPAIVKSMEKMGGSAGVRLAGVICVVDASVGSLHFDRHEEARIQAESSDRILLSKMDIAPEESVRQTHLLLDKLAPNAERASFPRGEDAGFSSWMLEQRSLVGKIPSPRQHKHGQISAVSYSDPAPLIGDLLLSTLDRYNSVLLRAKGYVSLVGGKTGFLEFAGAKLKLEERAIPDHVDGNEFVLIGEGLDENELRRSIAACRAKKL